MKSLFFSVLVLGICTLSAQFPQENPHPGGWHPTEVRPEVGREYVQLRRGQQQRAGYVYTDPAALLVEAARRRGGVVDGGDPLNPLAASTRGSWDLADFSDEEE